MQTTSTELGASLLSSRWHWLFWTSVQCRKSYCIVINALTRSEKCPETLRVLCVCAGPLLSRLNERSCRSPLLNVDPCYRYRKLANADTTLVPARRLLAWPACVRGGRRLLGPGWKPPRSTRNLASLARWARTGHSRRMTHAS